MPSILYRASSGVAGDVTRPDHTTIEAGLLNAAKPALSFGIPVKAVAGKFEPIEAADAATVFFGVLSRNAPAIGGDLTQGFGTGTPNLTAVQGVVREGYVNVKVAVGTPARGGQVWMRTTAASGKLVGDFETAQVVAELVALAGVTWAVDGKDAGNLTEISIA
jgi:hypothetical protein